MNGESTKVFLHDVPNLWHMMNSFNMIKFINKNEITYELEAIYDGVDIDWKILD